MDESALGESLDEARAANAMMVYILNPWPWFAVGVPIAIIAAISLIASRTISASENAPSSRP